MYNLWGETIRTWAKDYGIYKKSIGVENHDISIPPSKDGVLPLH